MGNVALNALHAVIRDAVVQNTCLQLLQDYCAPKINYADVRKRVQHAFAEKAYEIADATAAVLSLSKEGATLMEEIRAQCS